MKYENNLLFSTFFSFKSTFINRRSSQATPCTWCWPPPSSTSLFLFLPSFSSTPGGTSFQNIFSLHFLHDGLKDLQITNHSSSSYSILYSLLPSSHFSGSDWLCSETKCKDVPWPAPEEGSVRRRGDLLGQCHPRVVDGRGCEFWRSMWRGDVALFGNVEMIAYKDAMIESVRASLFWNMIYCGFSSNWILHYFPLSVCPSVRVSQAWHLTFLTYIKA